MTNNVFKNNYHILLWSLLLFSIYIGFFLSENITQGPKLDFEHALKQVEIFEKDFIFAFFNFDKIEHSTRISPIFISILFFLKNVFGDIDLVRFILMNIILINQLIFYNCLKYSSLKNVFHKRTLFLISSSIFLSPSFRANSIWPESSMLGLLFFLFSIYFFLRFKKNYNLKFIFLNIIFLSLASYIRPSFCLFAIYFFFEYCFDLHKRKDFFKLIGLIIFCNLILAFPAFYYVFILDIFFISYGGLSSNYFNKISIITTIIFFHITPIIFLFLNNYRFQITRDIFIILISIVSLIVISKNFDYNLNNAGGGIILHLSNYIFENNYLFFFVYLFSLFFMIKISLINLKNNLILYLILLLITPQYHIFHKYYDPLVIILCLTIFEKNLINKRINGYLTTLLIFLFYIALYSVHFINNNFIN